MSDRSTPTPSELLASTSEIVAAYVSNHTVSPSSLPDLIQNIYQAVESLHGKPYTPKAEPAVPIKDSISPDYIVCLEDGKKLKMLKRYLKTAYNMTPEEYRAKWNLPPDYPMVAPNYAKQRSKLAKEIGLGKDKGGK